MKLKASTGRKLRYGSTSVALTALIIAISLNMLGLTKIKVMNYLQSILLPILFCLFM